MLILAFVALFFFLCSSTVRFFDSYSLRLVKQRRASLQQPVSRHNIHSLAINVQASSSTSSSSSSSLGNTESKTSNAVLVLNNTRVSLKPAKKNFGAVASSRSSSPYPALRDQEAYRKGKKSNVGEQQQLQTTKYSSIDTTKAAILNLSESISSVKEEKEESSIVRQLSQSVAFRRNAAREAVNNQARVYPSPHHIMGSRPGRK